MKLKILITAAGTATSWHLCQIIKEYFDDVYEIHLSDINNQELVPASIYAYRFHKIPSIFDENYETYMYELIKKEKINIVIPLIDFDLSTFASDNEILKELNIISTAPKKNTTTMLSNKFNLFEFLNKYNIPTPKLYTVDNVSPNEEYAIKPIQGFGSRGFRIESGKDLKESISENEIIQELCNPKEVTAEVYCKDEILKIFVRERIETKSGVCTKMKPLYDDEIIQSIKKLVKVIECPVAFCIQFMKNKENNWCISDCNLRLGAGTALSTKIGFQLTRALLATLANQSVDESLFEIDTEIKSVLRVYDEVVIK